MPSSLGAPTATPTYMSCYWAQSAKEVGEARTHPKELEILVALVGGAGNGEIAQHLAIGEATVKQHMSVLFTKLQCNNRCKLATRALRLGLCSWGMAASNTTQGEESFSCGPILKSGEKAGSTPVSTRSSTEKYLNPYFCRMCQPRRRSLNTGMHHCAAVRIHARLTSDLANARGHDAHGRGGGPLWPSA